MNRSTKRFKDKDGLNQNILPKILLRKIWRGIGRDGKVVVEV